MQIDKELLESLLESSDVDNVELYSFILGADSPQVDVDGLALICSLFDLDMDEVIEILEQESE